MFRLQLSHYPCMNSPERVTRIEECQSIGARESRFELVRLPDLACRQEKAVKRDIELFAIIYLNVFCILDHLNKRSCLNSHPHLTQAIRSASRHKDFHRPLPHYRCKSFNGKKIRGCWLLMAP